MQGIQRESEQISSMLSLANKMALRFGRIGPHDPEDIAQMALLKVWKHTKEQQGSDGWLFTVVRNTAYDAMRKHRRELQYRGLSWHDDYGMVCELADEEAYVPLGRTTYSLPYEEPQRELALRVYEAVDQLSPAQREVLTLHTQGLSYDEIAQKTNAKIGTVRSRLHYARKQAKCALDALS
jgi:RNA polymerase sigma factor (sigma-70 family)